MSKGRKETKKYGNGEKHAGNPSRTSLITLGVALAVVIIIGATLFLPRTKAGPPRIWLSETFWNFGRTPQQSRISHTFWIKNIGGDTLRIAKVKPG